MNWKAIICEVLDHKYAYYGDEPPDMGNIGVFESKSKYDFEYFRCTRCERFMSKPKRFAGKKDG